MYRTLVQLLDERVAADPLFVAQYGKNSAGAFVPTTYIQLQEQSRAFALALKDIGVKRGDRVAIISDNRQEWLVSDLGILSLGAIDVPRGRESMDYELEYIISATDAKVVISENLAQTEKLLSILPNLPKVEMIIAIEDDAIIPTDKVEMIAYKTLLQKGMDLLSEKGGREEIEHEILLGSERDSATIIFTSGTTGNPKGVVLSHESFLYQVENVDHAADFKKGEVWLSVLPVWHAFERVMQYMAIYETEAIAYSKPIGKIMLLDIQRINPHYIGSVPRIWETIKAGVEQALKNKKPIERKLFYFFLAMAKRYKKYEFIFTGRMPRMKKHENAFKRFFALFPYLYYKPMAYIGKKFVFSPVTAKLGKNYQAGVSGGGSMSAEAAEFFNAIGITLLDGYGLTETGPIVGTGTVTNTILGYMKPLDGTEIKVVDPETGKSLPVGNKGELLVRGKQVMDGYYKDKEKTDAVIDKEGFLKTGDLAVMEVSGWFRIVGRIKDTIVLAGGENVEPVPIEQAISNSEYIERAVVVGQDKKSLGALILLDSKNVEYYLKNSSIPYISRGSIAEMEEVKTLISHEIMRNVSREKGFKAFEEISRFTILDTSFSIGKELSAKQEIKRLKINELYAKEIEAMWMQ